MEILFPFVEGFKMKETRIYLNKILLFLIIIKQNIIFSLVGNESKAVQGTQKCRFSDCSVIFRFIFSDAAWMYELKAQHPHISVLECVCVGTQHPHISVLKCVCGGNTASSYISLKVCVYKG